MALHVNTSALTAIANGYSYNDVFVRQVEAFGRPKDVLIGISTSGKSENILSPRFGQRKEFKDDRLYRKERG